MRFLDPKCLRTTIFGLYLRRTLGLVVRVRLCGQRIGGAVRLVCKSLGSSGSGECVVPEATSLGLLSRGMTPGTDMVL
jgi:hypothetical protein